MENKEQIYDEQIAPLMTKIIEISKKEVIPMFALFQYSNEDFCKTLIPSAKDHHCLLTTLEALSQCIVGSGINIDKFFLWCRKTYPNKSSIIMSLLGSDPVENKAHCNHETAIKMQMLSCPECGNSIV